MKNHDYKDSVGYFERERIYKLTLHLIWSKQKEQVVVTAMTSMLSKNSRPQY